ncbi:MAG TPA: flagellar type III secretion system pore protein FliP [Hyphomicrobium sp.]|nr:flagellar type III secretion system pore protein FliP [Hyphomicrobium sp.]
MAAGAGIAVMLAGTAARAQGLNLDGVMGGGQTPTAAGGIIQMLLVLTAISLAPGILMMATCFTRFIIALSFLRAGLGLQTTPSNIILINLALFMTWFVMAPTFEQAWQSGLKPMMEEKITSREAVENMVQPFKVFMKANVRDKDAAVFQGLVKQLTPDQGAADVESIQVLVPAFIVSELRRGFEIGFLIALPFLVIDIVVASIVMSMGMMMVSPIVFSLPLKVLFFVLIDGWSILVAALIRSYA